MDRSAKQLAGGESRAINLATEADFDLGPVRVRPALLVIESDETIQVEPRVMQVLIALARVNGATVTRDALTNLCWGGAVVGEDAINRALSKVRRVAERCGHAFRIETTPRVGYRLLVDGAPSRTAAPSARRAWAAFARKRALIAGLMLAATIAAGLLLLDRIDAEGPALATLKEKNDPFALAASAAIAETSALRRAQAEAAVASLRIDDPARALDLLEAMARDYEARGKRHAAADAYTRLAAIALISDAPRGLAARRRAFALDPESIQAFQGLFFDTFLLKGPEAAIAVAEESLAAPASSMRMHGVILALRSIAEMDGLKDMQRTRATLAEIDALAKKGDDDFLASLHRKVAAQIAWAEDDLREATRLADMIAPPEIAQLLEVAHVRIQFSAGDWSGAFAESRSLIEVRRDAGLFLPMPLVTIACRAGVLVGAVARAAPYCDFLAEERSGVAGEMLTPRAHAAFIDAARGHAARAQTHLDALDAIIDPENTESRLLALWVGTYAAGRRGEIAAAEEALQKFDHLMRGSARYRGQQRSQRAAAHRMFAVLALDGGETARGCAALREANALYQEIGADAGARETEALLLRGCV